MRTSLVVALLPSLAFAAPSPIGTASRQQAAAPHKKSTPPGKAADEQAARGDAWTLAGRCDEAIAPYRKALEIDPSRAKVKIRLAHCLAQTGARAEADAILNAMGDDPAALQEKGDLAMAAGDARAAVLAYERAALKSPAEAHPELLEALAQLAQKDPEAKTRALKLARALRTHPAADGITRRRAEELESLLMYGESAPDVIAAKNKLAAGDARGAIALLEKVVAAHADLEEAQYLLGMAWLSDGKKDDARRAFAKAPKVKEAQLQLGVDAFEGGDLEEAEKRLRAAVALDGALQSAHYQLGLVLHERGASDGARDAWRRAILIDPKSELGKWAATKLQMLTGNVTALVEGQVIDPSSEIEIGQKLGKQLIERFGRVDDAALEARLEGILRKLAAVSDRPERDLRWRVILIDAPLVNALTLPGGTILMFRGVIDLVKNRMGDKDDGYAAILGHECAHAALRHGVGMIKVASSLGGRGANPFAPGAAEIAGLLNTVSRAHEFEADQFGALYAYRAGFDPAAGLKLHDAMRAQMGELPRGMTHPTHAERNARMRDYLLDLRAKVRGFDLAVKQLGEGDYLAAASRFEVFLGVFPDSIAARSNLGVALHRQALAAMAAGPRYRRSTDVDPNSRARKIELRSTEAKVDERLLREAAHEYRAALEIDPAYPRAMVNLGAVLEDLKDHKGSRATLERAVRLAPSSKEAWNNLGAVAAGVGDTARGLEALKKAVELDGNYAEAWFNLALAHEQNSDHKSAAAAWDKYLALDGKSGWAEIARKKRASTP